MNMKKRTLRTVSPANVRFVWQLVQNVSKRCSPTLDQVINEAHQSGLYREDLPKYVNGCSEEGLLTLQDGIYAISGSETVDQSHDWYCFVCHLAGEVILCNSCHRVYHLSCLDPSQAGRDRLVCSVCKSVSKEFAADTSMMYQFQTFLLWAHNKYNQTLTCIPGSSMSLSQYHLLVVKPVDLSTMKSKVMSQQYASPRQFFADFQQLHHNTVLVFGEGSQHETHAKELLKQAEREVVHKMEEAPHGMASMGSFPLQAAAGLPVAYPGMVNMMNAMQQGHMHGGDMKKKSKKRSSDGNEPGTSKRKRREKETDQAPIVSSSSEAESRRSTAVQAVQDEGGGCSCDCETKFRRLIMQLQSEWIEDYKADKEKTLVEVEAKLEEEFDHKYVEIQTQLKEEYRKEIEKTHEKIDSQYAARVRKESQDLISKHKKQLSEAKKKQWCWQCEREAIYFCCWNTAYCSVECQQKHWQMHKKSCRRKRQQNDGKS